MIRIDYIWPWQTRSIRRWIVDSWKYRFNTGVCVLGLIIEFEDYRIV